MLVNNAGGVAGQGEGQGPVPLEDVSDEAWNLIFDINLNAVIFFASDLAGFVNGQILAVEGGR